MEYAYKDLSSIDVRFFCFPDTYEIDISHLGIKILYHLLNEQKGIYAEQYLHHGLIWKMN